MFCRSHKLSYFQKVKKQFTTARPVIQFHNSPYQKLYRATASILLDISRDVYSGTQFGIHTLQEAFKVMSSLNLTPAQVSNQDLDGFFTSVAQSRIMEAVSTTMIL